MTLIANPQTAVIYRDRQTRKLITENIFAENTLRWLYEDSLGFQVFQYFLNHQVFCWLYGKLQELPSSRKKIPDFVAKYQIKMEEAELAIADYPHYNAFFYRQLKPEARPIPQDSSIFCAPAEGKVLVYPRLTTATHLPVKTATITIESLLASTELAKPYHHGSALIVRLAPYDYHRFHFPDDGLAQPTQNIKGEYHSVNPIALTKIPDVFCRNKRSVTEFDSQNFGKIAYIEVGAICVGSIIQTFTPGQVKKGQEKGYFKFGGSTVVLLFEPGAIVFDEDLITDSADQIEVHVQALSKIGKVS